MSSCASGPGPAASPRKTSPAPAQTPRDRGVDPARRLVTAARLQHNRCAPPRVGGRHRPAPGGERRALARVRAAHCDQDVCRRPVAIAAARHALPGRRTRAGSRLSAKDAALLAWWRSPGRCVPTGSRRCSGRRSAEAGRHQPAPAPVPAAPRRRCGAGRRRRVVTLAGDVDTDLAATLAAIAVDEHAGRDELLGDLDFDDLPELADWLRQRAGSGASGATPRSPRAAAQCETERRARARPGLRPAPGRERPARRARPAPPDAPALPARRPGGGDGRVRALRAAPEGRARRRAPRPRRSSCWRRSSAAPAALPARRAAAAGEPAAAAAADRPRRRAGSAASTPGRPARLPARRRGRASARAAWCSDFAAGRARRRSRSQARPGDAGVAYALLARLLRAVLAAHRCASARARASRRAGARAARARPCRSRSPARRSACCCSARSTRRCAEAAGATACRRWSSTTCSSPTTPASSSCRRWRSRRALAALRWGFAQRPGRRRRRGVAPCAPRSRRPALDASAAAARPRRSSRALVDSLGARRARAPSGSRRRCSATPAAIRCSCSRR